MILLPAAEECSAILEQLVNEEGVQLAVQKDVNLQLEDSRGRKFGSGAMVLADVSAGCCDQFQPTPALRGPAQHGLLRMTAMGAVARPSVKNALVLSEQWISEMSGVDEAMMEYYTAEEVVAAAVEQPPAEQPNGQVDAEVAEQMQARLAELEATLPPQQSVIPVVDFQPRSRVAGVEARSKAAGRSMLFGPMHGCSSTRGPRCYAEASKSCRSSSSSLVSRRSAAFAGGHTSTGDVRRRGGGGWGRRRDQQVRRRDERSSAPALGIAAKADSSFDAEVGASAEGSHNGRAGQRRRKFKLWSQGLRSKRSLPQSNGGCEVFRPDHSFECSS